MTPLGSSIRSGFTGLLVWEMEWRIALARKRLFLLNVAVPLLLVLPIALSAAPRVHAAAVYSVLFIIHPTFGSAVPLVRDAERGMASRMLRSGVGAEAFFLQRAAAGAILDAVQLLPAVVVGWWGLGARPASVPLILAGLVSALWISNLVGVVVAAAARSVAETALFAAVAALLLLHMSGVFRTPSPDSWGASFEAVAPYRLLHEALLASGESVAVSGVAPALAWAVALAVILGLGAGRLGARLAP